MRKAFSKSESTVLTRSRYFLTDYYLADLIMKDNTSDRKGVLRRAQQSYEHYLHRLSDYSVLSRINTRLYERFLQERDSFSLILSSDASSRRDAKIARFKQEKELKLKLDFLMRVPQALQGDDTAARELYLAEIELNTHHTFHNLDLIAQELKILTLLPVPLTPEARGEERASDHRDHNGRGGPDAYSERLDPPLSELQRNGKADPILDRAGKPLKPFTLLNQRQELRAGVFKSGHNLPTMTIDEYLAEERRRGGIVEGGGEVSAERGAEVDEDDMEKADQETMKAREWDEFVEANPKGSGNTINRG